LGRFSGTGFETQDCNIFISDGAGNVRIFACGSTGFVGVNTTAPSQRFHVDGNIRVTGAFYDSSNAAGSSGQVLSSTGTGTQWVAGSSGTVSGSGAVNLVTYWDGTSSITGSAGFTFIAGTLTVPSLVESSALRFKENIHPLTGSLDNLEKIQGYTFVRKGEDRQEIGFIADYVKEVYPELISHDEDGNIHGIQYPRVTAVLVEGIKELRQQIQNQEIFIQDLKSRIERLEKK
jgi:hypothetical protein